MQNREAPRGRAVVRAVRGSEASRKGGTPTLRGGEEHVHACVQACRGAGVCVRCTSGGSEGLSKFASTG